MEKLSSLIDNTCDHKTNILCIYRMLEYMNGAKRFSSKDIRKNVSRITGNSMGANLSYLSWLVPPKFKSKI
jgi:hypothetical protein